LNRERAIRRAVSDAGAQDDVADVPGARWRVDARLDRAQLDREIVAEQAAEVVGTDVVRRVDAPRLHVLAVLVVEVSRFAPFIHTGFLEKMDAALKPRGAEYVDARSNGCQLGRRRGATREPTTISGQRGIHRVPSQRR
jgi:hypothetical protein